MKKNFLYLWQMRILIVEDEIKVASFIKKGLEEYGWEADIALDALLAKKLLAGFSYDLIILDLNLPKVSGLDFCRSLRQQFPYLPVLMLTAMGTTADKLAGFDAGTDDYLVKPFDFEELVARLRVLNKRHRSIQPGLRASNTLQIDDLELNLDTKETKRAGRKIELTAREMALLDFFLRNQNRALSRAEIAANVWDVSFDTGTNVVDVYVNYLRRKIDKDFPTKLIYTLPGIGYIMRREENNP